MYYKIEKNYTKTNEQDWSGVIISIERSMNPTFDERDNDSKKKIVDEEKPNFVNKFKEIINELGEDYVGWDREYVDENQLKIIYYFKSIESARTFYVKSFKGQAMYSISWYIVDLEGNRTEIPQKT